MDQGISVHVAGRILISLLATSASLFASGLDAPVLTSPEIVRGADRFEFTYKVTLPEIRGTGRLWVPLAGSDAFQTVEVEKVSAPREWKPLTDPDYQNKILYLSAGPEESGKVLEVRYRVTRLEKEAYPATDESKLRRELGSERLVPVNDRFREIATEATAGKMTALERGRALYLHVLDRMRYDKTGTGWGNGDALWACDSRTGNCTDFHSYFIALARSIGIPARFAIGATIPAGKTDGEISGYHCWAEFSADGRWIPVDISEADKHPELAEYYFGHHPANRFELSRGRDLVVEPAPTSGPINFMAYPLLEVEGKVIRPETVLSFRRVEEHPSM